MIPYTSLIETICYGIACLGFTALFVWDVSHRILKWITRLFMQLKKQL